MSDDGPLTLLDEITTRWSVVTNSMTFVLRYGPAVRAYLAALLPHSHDADDATQDFLLRTLSRPTFSPDRVTRGRFRDYLKSAIRHAAIDAMRSKKLSTTSIDPESISQTDASADSAWVGQWRQILLDRCWDALESQQRSANGNHAYRVLRMTMDDPQADSTALAERLSLEVGSVISSDAFRKQRSRARREFAKLLIGEVKQTLESPSAEQIVDELAALGLLEYVRDYLPERWRDQRNTTAAGHSPS